MTEAEWLAADDPDRLVQLLGGPIRVPPRKRVLFACACCRRVWTLLADGWSRRAVELREQHTGEPDMYAEVWEAGRAAEQARDDAHRRGQADPDAANTRRPAAGPEWAAVAAAAPDVVAGEFAAQAAACVAPDGWAAGYARERAAQADLLRDQLGNPFRPPAADPDWLTSTVVALARQMYDARDFAPMPILADALQDAGCEQPNILVHCRDPRAVHARGCWVVDLVLGKG